MDLSLLTAASQILSNQPLQKRSAKSHVEGTLTLAIAMRPCDAVSYSKLVGSVARGIEENPTGGKIGGKSPQPSRKVNEVPRGGDSLSFDGLRDTILNYHGMLKLLAVTDARRFLGNPCCVCLLPLLYFKGARSP